MSMKLSEHFEKTQGIGVLATTDASGPVNQVIHGQPHFLDDNDGGACPFIMDNHLEETTVANQEIILDRPQMSFCAVPSLLVAAEAGRPRIKGILGRRLQFTAYCGLTSWKKADVVFQAEGKKVLQLARTLPGDLLSGRGDEPSWEIDDRSCCWSAEMVLEHLIAAGAMYAEIMLDMSRGEKPFCRSDTTDHPEGGKGIRVLDDFEQFLDDYTGALAEGIGNKRSTLTHPHPWFGELTACQWHCLAALHQAFHRRHMERIISRCRWPLMAVSG